MQRAPARCGRWLSAPPCPAEREASSRPAVGEQRGARRHARAGSIFAWFRWPPTRLLNAQCACYLAGMNPAEACSACLAVAWPLRRCNIAAPVSQPWCDSALTAASAGAPHARACLLSLSMTSFAWSPAPRTWRSAACVFSNAPSSTTSTFYAKCVCSEPALSFTTNVPGATAGNAFLTPCGSTKPKPTSLAPRPGRVTVAAKRTQCGVSCLRTVCASPLVSALPVGDDARNGWPKSHATVPRPALAAISLVVVRVARQVVTCGTASCAIRVIPFAGAWSCILCRSCGSHGKGRRQRPGDPHTNAPPNRLVFLGK